MRTKSTPSSSVKRNPTNSGMTTGEAAKARVYAKGLTLKQFAQQHDLNYRTVSEVIRGVNKGLFGEGHRAAVALGIKQGA